MPSRTSGSTCRPRHTNYTWGVDCLTSQHQRSPRLMVGGLHPRRPPTSSGRSRKLSAVAVRSTSSEPRLPVRQRSSPFSDLVIRSADRVIDDTGVLELELLRSSSRGLPSPSSSLSRDPRELWRQRLWHRRDGPPRLVLGSHAPTVFDARAVSSRAGVASRRIARSLEAGRGGSCAVCGRRSACGAASDRGVDVTAMIRDAQRPSAGFGYALAGPVCFR